MQIIAEKCSFVHGFHPVDGSKVDPSPFTARAVFEGIKKASDVVFGSADLTGRRILIQGVGNVGMNLGGLLAEAGASLLVSDIDADRTAEAARHLGATAVAAAEVYKADCDIYAPCAVGATLNEATIPDLRCRIVAGSANNQLAEPADAQRLLGTADRLCSRLHHQRGWRLLIRVDRPGRLRRGRALRRDGQYRLHRA